MCDDVVRVAGDLDWEFAFLRALGIRPALPGGQNDEKRQEKV